MPLPEFPLLQQLQKARITSPVRLTTLSVTLGIALIGFLAVLLRRRRRNKTRDDKDRQRASSNKSENTERNYLSSNLNGDLVYRGRRTESPSSMRSLLQQKSLSASLSSIGGASSASTITHPTIDTTNMSPIQLCQLGFETLQNAVTYWEDGLMKLTNSDNPHKAAHHHHQDPELASLHHQLDIMLDSAYRMIDRYERQCERKGDQFAFDTAIAAFTEVDQMSTRRSLDAGSSSDQESFVSATDMADLSDLDSHREMFQHLALYEVGLLELRHGTVPCRTLRVGQSGYANEDTYALKRHSVKHKQHSEKCSTCGKQVKHFEAHMKRCSVKKQRTYKYDICDKMLLSKIYIRKHNKDKHRESTEYKCDCGTVYLYKYSLNRNKQLLTCTKSSSS